MTKFTINNTAVYDNSDILSELNAIAVMSHDSTPTRWDSCRCGGTCNWKAGLPPATTFETPENYSRSYLVRRFGKDAMVRGVSNY